MARFLLTWAAAFAVVLAVLTGLAPLLDTLALWQRALIISGLMVAVMQCALAPLIGVLLKRVAARRV